MSVRLGVELSPISCRFVVLDMSPARGQDAFPTGIRAFGRLPRDGAHTRNELSKFRGRPAAAVVWGLQADHRHAVVPHGSFRRMRRDAVAEMQGAGVETRGRVADIFASSRASGAPTRSVVVALASTPGLVSATRYLGAQGLRVQSIVTPALALMSLARLRRDLTTPDRIEAYVALEESTTAIALVRNGLLLAATELTWGYQDRRGMTLPAEEIAGRLADEIERFLAARSARPDVMEQVCICGGLPELRSMAIRLMEQLDVEVETLDSLFGIDPARLPDPPRQFREHAPGLRLAWAVAADWPVPVNLLRERRRRLTKTMLSRAAVAAGVATGVGVAWQVEQSDWWRSISVVRPAAQRMAGRGQAEGPGPAMSLPAPPPSVAVHMEPALQPERPNVAHTPPPLQAGKTIAPERAAESAVPSGGGPPHTAAAATLPSVTAQPQVPSRIAAAATKPPDVTSASLDLSPAPGRSVRRTLQPSVAQLRESDVPLYAERQPLPDRGRIRPASEIALPFDAVLGTILYAPERKLAIVDGRIVQTGDEINGARVVEITPTTVLLRDVRGRLRQLGLAAATR